MSRRLVIRAAAERDLSDAAHWYESMQTGLGRTLVEAVDAALARIVEQPASFPLVDREIRRTLTGRFPFGIYFIIEPEQIVVLAILHASRHPRHWQSRIP